MGFVRCELPHFVHLVVPERCLISATNNYPGLSFPQTLVEVEDDFSVYAENGLLTLVDDRQPERLRISFCTSQYELVCGLTQDQTTPAFLALSMSPVSLRTHHQIARGAVRLVTQAWGLFEDLQDLTRQVVTRVNAETPQTGIEAILACWKQAREPVAPLAAAVRVTAPGSSPAELTFLANIDTLIELACQVELEQSARQERARVRSVEALTTARGPVYRFLLVAPAGFRAGEYLRAGLGDAGVGEDGVVVEAGQGFVTLRFFQAVELTRLQKMEWLLPKISTRQYTIQHAAVSALRNGQSLNQGLLALLVENRFEPFAAPTASSGTGRPNPAQKTMLERALLVPDLLLALGPPGTGKTDTIREIVARQAALGKKVLVTSKNNKAVDNVLEGLGKVRALRIGREEAVVPAVRPMLIDNLASAMRQGILDGILPVQENLENVETLWPQVELGIERVSQIMLDWRQAQSRLEHELAQLTNWQRTSISRVSRALESQKKNLQPVSARLGQAMRQAEAGRRRLEGLRKLSQMPLIGPIFRMLAAPLIRDWQRASRQAREALLEVRKSRENLRRTWHVYRQFVTAGEQALQFKRMVVQAEETLAEARTRIAGALEDLASLTAQLKGMPEMRIDSVTVADQLDAVINEWRAWYELMMHRRGLLLEWRDMLQTRPQMLYPALIRGVDVVGATCIGIATDLRFEDLEFDMVIADEAGQIQVMDLLVPLVRARRAILVGDHLQLPPVVEPEITRKLRENEPENQELGEWLEKSLFERLIERPTTPAGNTVMLNTQYRMPRQIADFISAQFYGGNYHTGLESAHTDAFFTGSPLVFVDTLREFRHYEQHAGDGQGYFNTQEASLISDLLLAYQSQGVEVGVIVPYKKQAEVIRRELRKRQPGLSEDELLGRVATVDSFQGREQDVIIFGFTRSNTEGRIGFLTELRRLNVSLTRARRQLVLVGDSTTLSSTADQDFATLIKALLESAKTTPKGYFYANELPRHIKP